MNSKTGDNNNDNMTGSKRRVFCDECFNLKRELSSQINAFETLAVLNPNLKSEILVQNLRGILSKVVEIPLDDDVNHVHDHHDHVHEQEVDVKTVPCLLPPEIEIISEELNQNQNLPQSSVQDEHEMEEGSFQNENSLNSQTSSSVEKDVTSTSVVTSTSLMTQGTNERKRKIGYQGKRRKGGKGRGKRKSCKKSTGSGGEGDEDALETRKSGRQINKRVNYTSSPNGDGEYNTTMDAFIELPPTKSKLSIFKSYKTRQQQTKEQNAQENSLEQDAGNNNYEEGKVGESNQEQQMEMMEIGNETPVKCNSRAGSLSKYNFNEASQYIKTVIIETGCSSYNIYQCTICDKQMTIWRNSCLHVLRVHFKILETKSNELSFYSYYKSPFHSSDPYSSSTTTTNSNSNGVVNVWSSPDDTSDLTVLNPFPNFDLKKTLSAHIVVKMLAASRIPQRPVQPLMLPPIILNRGKTRGKSSTKRRKAKGKFTVRKNHSSTTNKIYKNTNSNNNINTITTKTTKTNVKIKKPRKIPLSTISKQNKVLNKMKQQQQQLLDQQYQPQKQIIPQHQQQSPKQMQHRRKRKPQKIVRVSQNQIQSLSIINGLNPGAGFTTSSSVDDYIDPNNPPVFARKSKPSSNPPPFMQSSPPSAWNSFTSSPSNNISPIATTITTSSPTVEPVTAFTPVNSITGIDRDNWNDLEMHAEDVINLNNSGNTSNTNDSIYHTFAPFLPPPSIMPVHQDHDHLHVSGQSQVPMEFAPLSPLLPSILPYPPIPYAQMNGYQADSTSVVLNGNGINGQSELGSYHPHPNGNHILLQQDPLKSNESDDENDVDEQDPFLNSKVEDELTEEEEEDYQEEEEYEEECNSEEPGIQQKRVGNANLSKLLASQEGKLYSRPQKKKASTADIHKQIRVHSKTCFECMACNRKFKLMNLARNHYRRIHLREHEIICNNCGKRSTNLGSFKWHVKTCRKFTDDYIIS